jgi:hypothetical protein
MLFSYIVYRKELHAKLHVNDSLLLGGMQLTLNTIQKGVLLKDATPLLYYKTPCNITKIATL